MEIPREYLEHAQAVLGLNGLQKDVDNNMRASTNLQVPTAELGVVCTGVFYPHEEFTLLTLKLSAVKQGL